MLEICSDYAKAKCTKKSKCSKIHQVAEIKEDIAPAELSSLQPTNTVQKKILGTPDITHTSSEHLITDADRMEQTAAIVGFFIPGI